ncbi:MAG TPA: VWA domain-containing protein [Candidatus Binatia bacterium]
MAALLDQERPNIFTQALANLMPGASVEIEITYVEPLRYAGGAFELAFPTVVGPRFIPGAPTGASGTGWADDTTDVPDASRITPPVVAPGTRPGHDIDIAATIDAGVPILDVTAPLHEVDVERPGPNLARVRLRDRAEIPNRDFVLRYAVAEDTVRSGYLAHRDGAGDGYLSVVLVPPRHVAPREAAPKELVFVIDRSGSQAGLPLQKAKETMSWILDHLNPSDTFQIIDFGSTANVLFAAPELATESAKQRARAHIATLEANGGTMMADAVRAACAIPADAHRLRIVTFMTDGYVGNDFEILGMVRALRGTSRWFPFGTGNAVNRFLIDGMAREGGGEPDYVLLSDPGEKVAARFYEKIAAPALTDVRLEFPGLDVTDVTPSEPSDVWAERPLVIHARYRAPGKGQVVLQGYRAGQPYRQVLDVTLPAAAPEHAAIASMWARARVDDLMARDLGAAQRGEVPDAIREEIVSLALAHRLMTQFTSFVAVEDRVVNEGGKQHTETVEVAMPDGVSYEGVFGAGARDAVAAGKVNRLAAAPASRAEMGGAQEPSGPALDSLMKHRRADSPAAAAPTHEEDRRQLAQLDDAVRAKLSFGLVTLLTDPSVASVRVTGGRVTVRVRLRERAGEMRAALEAAGLAITETKGRLVIGTIEPGRLAALTALGGVQRVAESSDGVR